MMANQNNILQSRDWRMLFWLAIIWTKDVEVWTKCALHTGIEVLYRMRRKSGKNELLFNILFLGLQFVYRKVESALKLCGITLRSFLRRISVVFLKKFDKNPEVSAMKFVHNNTISSVIPEKAFAKPAPNNHK